MADAIPTQEQRARAEADAALEIDPLAEEFFSRPTHAGESTLEDWEPRPLSLGERRAVLAALSLLATAAFTAFVLLLFPARDEGADRGTARQVEHETFIP